MLRDPGQGVLHRLRSVAGRGRWPVDHDDGQSRFPGGYDLALGRSAAAVLADHHRNAVRREQPPLRRKRERSARSEEHTSELQSLMRSSYAVFCLKKKKIS